MSYAKHGLIVIASSVFFLLQSCVSTTPIDNTYQQSAAVERWHGCLDRHTPVETASMVLALRTLAHSCDGHKRDVIATFPRHMEQQINTTLNGAVRSRIVNTMHSAPKSDPTASRQVISH